MTIDRVSLTHIRIPLVEPFRISNGVVEEKDGIIVGVHADGLVGYGEASPMSGSFYSSDTPESTWSDLRNMIVPRLLRNQPDGVKGVNDLLDQTGGNPFARAGVETAFWDLEGQRTGVPLYRLLGSETDEVECGLAVGIYPSLQEMLRAVERHLCEGYTRLKIKIQPGWDIEPLRAVRERFGEIPLMVDANCAYTAADLEHLKRLDEFRLMMVEQPLPKGDLEGHARLQSALTTPLCLDESATDLATVSRAIAMKSCKIVNIKIQRVGGLQAARGIHDLCRAHGVPVWGGTMPELGIGSAQTVHLSTLPNFLYPTDVQSSLRWFVDDCIEPLLEARAGRIRIPGGVGNCYRLDTTKVSRYLVRREEFAA
jgi:O-succinylbenzoate synthase